MKRQLLSALIAAALISTPAWATPAAPEAVAKTEAVRAEINELVQRIKDLSRELPDDNVQVQVQVIRGGKDGAMAPDPGHRELRMERREDGPRVGVGIVMAPDEKAGVRIAAITPGGPADKAGLKVGDILRSVHGKPVKLPQDVVAALQGIQKGQSINISYQRDDKTAAAAVTADTIRRAMLLSSEAPMWSPHADFERDVRVVIDPNIRIEIDRAGVDRERALGCAADGKDCQFPALTQALRWNGLNLASVDAKLGRYFGTDTGVLVLGGGDALPGLEPGDVIQRIDGESVDSPREAMRALRERETGSQVKVDVLRDRKARSVEFTVPAAPSMRWFAPPPPPPPAPPAPPKPPKAGATPSIPAPPAAPPAPRTFA